MGPLPVTRPFEQKKSQIDSMVLQVVTIPHLHEMQRRGFPPSSLSLQNNNHLKQHQYQYPRSAMGIVTANINGLHKKSIGCLISPNILITCGTSIFCLENEVLATDIFLQLSNSMNQRQQFKVKSYYLHQQLKESKRADYNIALLYLQTKDDLELQYGSFGYSFGSKLTDELTDGSFCLLKPNYHQNSRIESIQKLKINLSSAVNQYKYETSQLIMTECPIVEEIEGEYQIIGFHCQDYSTKQWNFGVKLTPNLFTSILNFSQTKESFSLWLGHFGNEGVVYATTRTNHNPSIVNLGRTVIDDGAIPAIAESHWSQVVELSIMINEIANQCEPNLSNGKYTHLRNLNLRSNKIADKGLQNLCKGSWKSLTSLFLYKEQNMITSRGMKCLKQTNWRNLTKLSLNRNMIGPEGVEQLVKTDLKLIEFVDLSQTCLGDKGCEWLTQSKWRYLHTLLLGGNPITRIGAQHLSKCHWKRLSVLKMESCQLDLHCIEALRYAEWPQLTHLNLSNNKIGSKGCQTITKAHWPLLIELNLSSNDIDDIGITALTKGNFPELQSLHLYQNHFSTRLASSLICGNWKKIKEITFQPYKASVQTLKPLILSDWKRINNSHQFNIQDKPQFNQYIDAKFQPT